MIYLDNAATTLIKPPQVVQAVVRAMGSFGNDPAYAYEYEILVHKKNSQQAKYLIG